MKIQKFTSILLSLLLLASNLSMAINVHFCEGAIAGITTVFSAKEICEKPSISDKNCCISKQEKKHEDCCKDKVLDLSDQASDVIVKTFSFQIDAPFILNEWRTIHFELPKAQIKSQTIDYYCEANAPPLFKQLIFYA